jgi:hypothetical protein
VNLRPLSIAFNPAFLQAEPGLIAANDDAEMTTEMKSATDNAAVILFTA